MHISDGVLCAPVVAGTAVVALSFVAYGLKGMKEEEIPKVALMSATFFVGSLIHFSVGVSSVHLLLSGIIGLALGRRTPVAIAVSLILQLLLLQFGGLTSLGANILSVSLPAMFIGGLVRPHLGQNSKKDFALGAFAGGAGVVGTIFILILLLVESNLRFGFGAFSTANMLIVAHIPVVIIEAVVTGFAVQMIAKAKPEVFGIESQGYLHS